MRKGIYILPNLITLLSMFGGFYSIVASLNSDYERAAWAIMIASVFDVLDGWVARITHTATRFGIEIDSLSDVISFGVAPGVLIYTWTLSSFGKVGWLGAFFLVDEVWPDFLSWKYVWPIALIAVGAAILLRARR